MSFEITVKTEFSSAHRLRHYKGKCEELHGHNWKVEVTFFKERLDKKGMILDFKLAKKRLNGVLKELDHKYLNNLKYFKKTNPTSENIARYIYEKLRAKGKGQRAKLKKVKVYETKNSCACYYEE